MLLFWALLAMADPSSLRGVLTDVTGGTLYRAQIEVLENRTTVVVASATSDPAGKFTISPLTPGTYALRIRFPGFRLRSLTDIVVGEGESRDLGTVLVETPSCDAPGVICDTFSAEPVFPGLISQNGLDLQINCGADLRKGTASCPPDRNAAFKVAKDGEAIDALPANQNVIYSPGIPFDGCRSTTRRDDKIRLDLFNPAMDFCVRHRNGLISHVYYQGEVSSGSTFHFWQTTTRPVK